MPKSVEPTPDFTIVGGGLAGTLMALFLDKAGYTVAVFEKRSDPRQGPVEAGRSVNLALSTRGIEALRSVGIADQILDRAEPMRGRMIHPLQGDCVFQSYGTTQDEVLHSLSRLGLNIELLNHAEQRKNIRLHFATKCEGVDFDKQVLEFRVGNSTRKSRTPYKTLIGADGAFSAVRLQMQRLDRFNYEQDFIEHGYKELCIPPGPHGQHVIDKNSLHIWPRGSFMMIALPNEDGSFTCTLFWPYTGPNSFATLTDGASVERFFRATFPDAVPLMPTFVDDFLKNPVGSLVTVKCFPWQHKGQVALIGDACHAVLPFYGQGMNAAFEDCSVLSDCIKQHPTDFLRAFESYQVARKKHVDTLADLARENFIEMRDKVNSPLFQGWKIVENALHGWFPRLFVSLHGIVSFSTTPYADAVKRVRRQNQLLGAGVVALLLIIYRLF